MKTELEIALFGKYPKILTKEFSWGIDCDDGWYNLLDCLFKYLQFEIDNNKHNQVIATQIKEKFASLRVYYVGGDNLLDGAIRLAENMSSSICEVCGVFNDQVKTRNIHGWYKTLCDSCVERRFEKLNRK